MSVTLTDWLAACPVVAEPETAPPERSQFAVLLRDYRERAGLSCNEVARAVGIDPSYVSRMERDDREPARRPVVLTLAHALNLTDDEGDKLLISAGYAPPWLIDTNDLRRLRLVAQAVQHLAAVLVALGLAPELEARHGK